jgi:cytochrome c2
VVDKRVLFAEPIPIGERIRYILQPEDGVIALWTDSQNLILLTRAPDDDSSSYVEHFISSREWTEDRREAARGAVATCLQCHTYTPTPGSAAPHLVGVYNRPVAATAFPRYSSALLGLGGRWTVERLTAYLVNPQGVAPGCLMAQLGLKEETAGDVVQVLKALDSAN